MQGNQEYVILVDADDNPIGKKEKFECHMGEGSLHRAFSVFIFNSRNEVLLQQRSQNKPLWPGFWSNTCCSHPRENETYVEAAHRRLKEEMGMQVDVEFLYKFQYRAKYKNIGTENEVCAVLFGHTQGEPLANPDEVNNTKWVKWNELLKDVTNGADQIYTPWFLMEIQHLNEKYINNIFPKQ